MWVHLITTLLCVCLWKLARSLKSSWRFYSSLAKALSRFPVPEEHHWFFGVAHLVKDAESYISIMEKSVDKLGPKALAVWVTWLRPSLLVVHPDTMKAVLSASHVSAPKSSDYRFLIPWIGEGLFVSNGRKWERSRRLLTPAFHFDVLKPYISTYNDVAELLMRKITALCAGGESLDICSLINRATLDTVLRCALSYVDEGVQSTERTQHPFCEAVDKLKEIINRRTLDPMSHNDFLFSLKSDYREMKKRCDYVHEFSSNLIKLRKLSLHKDPSKLTKRHLDFLDILLTARDNDGVGLTDQEIRDEVDTFVLAGHDTTASAIMWTLYSLAKYPTMQHRVRDEIEGILQGRNIIEGGDIPKLQFTTSFIKESMRLYTPVPFVNRQLAEPVVIEGVSFPAGTRVDISPHCLHHNPAVWKDHGEFDPERFLPENISKKDAFAFLPFSAGQRQEKGTALGTKFAPVYATLTIGYLEEKLYTITETNYDTEFQRYLKKYWKRFLDDCFVPWTKSEEEFHNIMNCIGQHFAMNEIKVIVSRVVTRFEISLDNEKPAVPFRDLITTAKDGIYLYFRTL